MHTHYVLYKACGPCRNRLIVLPFKNKTGQFFSVRKERFHRSGIQMQLHHSTSRRQVDLPVFVAELVFLSYVYSAYFWHCVHNGHDKPDFFFLTCLVHCAPTDYSARVSVSRKGCCVSSLPFSETLTPPVFACPIPRSRWHAFTQAASYTLLLVCVVITSRQLHVVCVSCFNSATYEILFFSSYITDIHCIPSLALDEWACLYPVIKADVRNPKTWFCDEIVFFYRRNPFFLWGLVSLDLSLSRKR